MTYKDLLVEIDNSVATLTLNRPKTLNALNNNITEELLAALSDLQSNDTVRCIVLTGAGRAFSAGADLKDFSGEEEHVSLGTHLRQGFNRVALALVNMPKPVIGKINGIAAGAGSSIALLTDFRIASPNASFMQAFTKIGLVPDTGANWILPRLVGYPRAFELMASADIISADKALEYGMVNYVVPAESLDEITAAWAAKFANGPTTAFALAKKTMFAGLTSSLSSTLNAEAVAQDIAQTTHDFEEGVNAFLEKRAAKFTGK